MKRKHTLKYIVLTCRSQITFYCNTEDENIKDFFKYNKFWKDLGMFPYVSNIIFQTRGLVLNSDMFSINLNQHFSCEKYRYKT